MPRAHAAEPGFLIVEHGITQWCGDLVENRRAPQESLHLLGISISDSRYK